MRISDESRLLGLICAIDMLVTVGLVAAGHAREANPLLRFYLDMGAAWFLVVKSLLFLGPLYVLELLKRRRPRFVRGLLRVGIALYLFFYGLGVYQVNRPEGGHIAQASIVDTPSAP